MTAHALNHVASTPNVAAPDGKMSHDKRLAFVQAMTKHGLQHLDIGGAVGGFFTGAGQDFTDQNRFQANGVQLNAGTDQNQLGEAYGQAQSGLAQQQNLASTLTPGVSQGAGAQSALSGMLLNQANGIGPNPAQAQYNQNVNNLARQQAGAIASTKGISPALQARLIAEQGANAGQNAAGQAATLQAQQQIAAENNLQNLSATQVGQGAQAVQGFNNAGQNEQNILQGANTSLNNALVTQQSGLNNVNANVAAQNATANNQTTSGIFSGASSILGGLFHHDGGKVVAPSHYNVGGLVTAPTSGPQSFAGQWLQSSTNTSGPTAAPMLAPFAASGTISDKTFKGKDKEPSPAAAPQANSYVPGGTDIYQNLNYPEALMNMSQGANYADPNFATNLMTAPTGMMKGGAVKAKDGEQKAPFKGDDIKNDKIPALLSEGEVVMDRETLADKGPMGQMARAVAAHIEKKNKMKGKK